MLYFSFGDSDSQDDKARSLSSGLYWRPRSFKASCPNWIKDAVLAENCLSPTVSVGSSGGRNTENGVQVPEVDECVSVGNTECEAGVLGEGVDMKSAGREGKGKADITLCGGGDGVDVRSASGEGEVTGEIELGVVLKPEIVEAEPTVRGVDMLDEFQFLPGPPRKAVSGVRAQSSSKRNGIVPPATTVKNQVSNSFVYKK